VQQLAAHSARCSSAAYDSVNVRRRAYISVQLITICAVVKLAIILNYQATIKKIPRSARIIHISPFQLLL